MSKSAVIGPNTVFGDFIVEELIGEGAMGRVFRARQISLDRIVALKVLSFSEDSAEIRERFVLEARAAARLIHPNIVQIYAVGEHESVPYYAMEHVVGVDLDQIVRVPILPLAQNEIIKVIRAAAKALCIAATHGIVHRDIKPANIMISNDGQIKVMDFGLAKGISDYKATQPGLIVGTPAYMSPEQIMSKPVDTRSDIYSLGCVLFECLCGSPPFDAENLTSLLYQHLNQQPNLSRTLLADIQPELREICAKMLSKAPGYRYQSPEELIEALEKLNSDSSAAERALAQRVTTLCQEKNTRRASGKSQKSTRLKKSRATKKGGVLRTIPATPKISAASARARHKRLERICWGPITQLGLFRKTPGGRWSYSEVLARCPFAEGLAAKYPLAPGEKAAPLGDCLLCSNWNKRTGCAEAYCREMKSRKHLEGLKLAVECATAWSGAGRFDKAIPLLEEYIKDNPGDCLGYRELARIYDHPEYKGRDRRRSIVLYQRFMELARQAGGVPEYDLIRTEERVKSLLAQHTPGSGHHTAVPPQIPFQCFYLGKTHCFAFGALNAESLVIVRAGDMDPASGVAADDLGTTVRRITNLFKRLGSDKSAREARERTKVELQRLAENPFEQLKLEANLCVELPAEKITGIEVQKSREAGMISLLLKSGAEQHQLIFTEAWSTRAEQCHELLRRRILSCKPTQPAEVHHA